MEEPNKKELINVQDQEEMYQSIRGYVIDAQQKVYKAVNSAMIQAYWKIGEQIYRVSGENKRVSYGKEVLQFLSKKLTEEFGEGFDISNLRNIRKFYLAFPNRDALRLELSWTHYRFLMRISNEDERKFYTEEAAKAGWSSRQLNRQINTMYYQRILSSRDKASVAAEIELLESKQGFTKNFFVV